MRESHVDYPATRYERPNQPWVCGLAAEGGSCPAGPSARGHCPAMAECAPIRDGDRWICNRSTLRGGPCDVGPTPDGECGRILKCRPTRSLRSIRGRFVSACAMLALGVATIVLASNWRDRAIAPGPLARQHAQLMERTGEAAQCAACHAAAEQNIGGWMASLVSFHSEQPTQSQLCIKCHDKTISAALATSPHNVAAEVLEQIQDQRNLPLPHPKREESGIACSACHAEHRGAGVNLAAMNNAACQSCHQQQFESFAADHPSFGIWPYERRTRIAFNHAIHREKHFAEMKQAFDCRACHVEDSTGKVEILARYEAACAKCHDEKIATSTAKGVALLALPTLDVAALHAAGLDIGPWPKSATGDFDGRLPPAMKLLLAADPAAAQAIAKLGPAFDFQDVDPKDRGQLEASAAIAAAIKKLITELAASAQTTVHDRLSNVLGRNLPPDDVRALVAGLSPDTLRGAVDGWSLGGAATNGAQASPAGVSTPATNSTTRNSHGGLMFAVTGAWARDDATSSIRYRPSGHADPVLATWLQVVAETPKLNDRPIAAAMFKEMSKVNAPGLCVSCHSAENQAEHNGTLTINWQAFDPSTEPRGFTKFSHAPHLTITSLADCTHCHAVDAKAAAAAAYTDFDPARFVSDFAPLTKQHCTECHTARAAGDACQQCHNYHVDGKSARLTRSSK